MKYKFKTYRLNEMVAGDRFYFALDKKKVVWQLLDRKPFEIKVQKFYKVNYANCIRGGFDFTLEQFKADHHWVIYLRSINIKENEQQQPG